MKLKAKYKGMCYVCEKPINIGDPIWWVKETKKTSHINCTKAGRRSKKRPRPRRIKKEKGGGGAGISVTLNHINNQCSAMTKSGHRCTRQITQMGYKCEQHS